MNILACIVNFGDSQISYLNRLIDELKSFKNHKVSIVVNTNIPTLNPKIDKENIIYLDNYQLLPMTCRKTILENIDRYDLYLYTENDHLFREHHFDKFIEYNELLPDDRISGLIQYEEDNSGNKFYPAYHKNYGWDLSTVERHGSHIFAHFTNLHQASFIITNQQLNRISSNHNFSESFGPSKYSIKCKTNTDIYQFCGMKKVICIDEFNQNIVHHMPNFYINGSNRRLKLGKGSGEMDGEIKKCLSQ